MKKLFLLAFGLLIAASAAYCIPKEFNEIKVKPLIEKAFPVDQEVSVVVDQINTTTDYSSPNWYSLITFDAIVEKNEVVIPLQSQFRWHRIQTIHLDKAKKENTITQNIKPVDKRPDKK